MIQSLKNTISSFVVILLLMWKSVGLNKEIASLEDDIRAVCWTNIKRNEAAVDQESSYMGISDPTRLCEERHQQFDLNKLFLAEKKQLREEKNQLQALNHCGEAEVHSAWWAHAVLRSQAIR